MVVTIEKLTKHYGSRTAIQDIGFEVEAGTIFGFLGPNGAGKTTTIRVMLGLLRPTRGRARIFGLPCWSQSHRIKKEIGYLPGDLRLYSWMTAESALRLFGRVRGLDCSAEGRRLLAEFGLDSRVRVRNMSRGMRQKLGLILALAHRPRLLILDEPTASLDPIVQEKLYQELRARAADGAAVFFSSHTLSEVEDLCHRVVILREGRIVADESLEGLRAKGLRRVTIRWTGNAADKVEPPPFVKMTQRGAREWRGVLSGPCTELLHWCAHHPVSDVVIEEPDLSVLFQEYYR